MVYRSFADRLNQELDSIGLPQHEPERIEAFSKLIKMPRFKAECILHGEIIPSEDVLKTIADELEVSVEWLIGKKETH